jgi:Transposase
VRAPLLRPPPSPPSTSLDDSRDAEFMASSFRTDPRCFWTLAVADPIVVELREWSRITEDLGVERNRLVNRLREQLWRYFPTMLEFGDDLAANGCSNSGRPPTRQKARHLGEASIAAVLKHNRIRRLDAGSMRDALRTTGASRRWNCRGCERACRLARTAHPPTQPPDQRRLSPLDTLTACFVSSEESEPGQKKRHDAAILASLPEVGRTVFATILAEAPDPLRRRDYPALRSLTGGVAPRHQAVAKKGWSSDSGPAIHARPTRSTIGSASPFSTTREDAADALTAAPCSVADRLLNVACAMLKFGAPFDPSLPSKNRLINGGESPARRFEMSETTEYRALDCGILAGDEKIGAPIADAFFGYIRLQHDRGDLRENPVLERTI